MAYLDIEPVFYDFAEEEEILENEEQIAGDNEFDDIETDDLFLAVCRAFDEMKKYIQDQNLPILNKHNTISNFYTLVQSK